MSGAGAASVTSTLTALPASLAETSKVAVEPAADDCCEDAMAKAKRLRLITYQMTRLDRPI